MPHYQPNTTALPVLLGSFGSILSIVVGASLLLATRARPGLTRTDQAIIGWFVLCKASPHASRGSQRTSRGHRLMAGT